MIAFKISFSIEHKEGWKWHWRVDPTSSMKAANKDIRVLNKSYKFFPIVLSLMFFTTFLGSPMCIFWFLVVFFHIFGLLLCSHVYYRRYFCRGNNGTTAIVKWTHENITCIVVTYIIQICSLVYYCYLNYVIMWNNMLIYIYINTFLKKIEICHQQTMIIANTFRSCVCHVEWR